MGKAKVFLFSILSGLISSSAWAQKAQDTQQVQSAQPVVAVPQAVTELY